MGPKVGKGPAAPGERCLGKRYSYRANSDTMKYQSG
jgi:hypothetical protein